MKEGVGHSEGRGGWHWGLMRRATLRDIAALRHLGRSTCTSKTCTRSAMLTHTHTHTHTLTHTNPLLPACAPLSAQAAGLPLQEQQAGLAAVERVKAQVLVMLHSLGVDDPKWHSLAQGDCACMFHFVPSRRRGRSNSWEQLERQRKGRAARGGRGRLLIAGGADSLGEGDVGVQGGVAPSWEGQMDDDGAQPDASRTGCGSSIVFEGARRHRARRLAITLLAPWHLSVNAGGQPLVAAAVRDRVLARRGCCVLAIRVEEWLAMGGAARRQMLLDFLFAQRS